MNKHNRNIKLGHYMAVLYDMGNYLRSMGFNQVYYSGDVNGIKFQTLAWLQDLGRRVVAVRMHRAGRVMMRAAAKL